MRRLISTAKLTMKVQDFTLMLQIAQAGSESTSITLVVFDRHVLSPQTCETGDLKIR